MKFLSFEEVKEVFKGKSVAIVGSGPSVLDNEEGFIDSHDIVVRVNNFKTSLQAGSRTDVHYSFYGNSIRTSKDSLKDTYLCMCKCPDGGIDSPWHKRYGFVKGCDWRWIYEQRKDWWFTDTYIPTLEKFNSYFELLDKHIPTTGFSCILDISQFDCEIYLTGFDFFESGIHNVNERWVKKARRDPIGHVPEKEKQWVFNNKHRFNLDRHLNDLFI